MNFWRTVKREKPYLNETCYKSCWTEFDRIKCPVQRLICQKKLRKLRPECMFQAQQQ